MTNHNMVPLGHYSLKSRGQEFEVRGQEFMLEIERGKAYEVKRARLQKANAKRWSHSATILNGHNVGLCYMGMFLMLKSGNITIAYIHMCALCDLFNTNNDFRVFSIVKIVSMFYTWISKILFLQVNGAPQV